MTRSLHPHRWPAFSALALAVASVWQAGAYAQDIDIFLNNPSQNRPKPNVLLMIDNGANWASNYMTGVTKQMAVSDALSVVSQDSSLIDQVNLGMMLMTKDTNGGKLLADASPFSAARQGVFKCLVYGVTQVQSLTDIGLASLTPNGASYTCGTNWLANGTSHTIQKSQTGGVVPHCYAKTTESACTASAGYVLESGNNSTLGLMMHEAYQYFRGADATSGQVDGVMQASPDWETSPYTIYSSSATNFGSASSPQLGADPKAFESGTTQYISPAQTNSCANNFIILIGTVNGTLAGGEDSAAQSWLEQDSGAAAPSPYRLTPDNDQHSWSDEYAAFLARADVDPDKDGAQSVMTYVIDVFNPNANNADTDPAKAARALYKSIASHGKGRYFAASNADEVAAALTEILNEVQSVNTSFASASMPISMTAETQGTNENQVYIGMFRPDETGRPRWMGNLKRYHYLYNASTRTPYLADADDNAAYDPVTGFINNTTRSYWTQDLTNGQQYWRDMTGYDEPSDTPDGPVVEKGATGQLLRARVGAGGTRNLLTCPASCVAGSSFQTLTLATNNSWMYGYDMQDETGRADPTEARPSIHGDVLHSRPLVLNYNRSANKPGGGEDVVVFYGGNDGLFRALRGSDGTELWGMSFLEHRDQLTDLYDNQASADVTQLFHPYFMDGSPTSLTTTVTTASGDRYIDKAWMFLPMRRGGDFMYAVDASTPAAPKFMWKIQGGSGSFSALGQTWSNPKPAYVKAYTDADGIAKPVLFFGAGYDAAAEDFVAQSGNRPARTRGQGIYMVDAETGAPLWYGTATGMDFSVAGDLTLVNYSRSAENYADRIYFADTGGNLWRANIGGTNIGGWNVEHIANLGGTSPNCSATSNLDCRKFLYNPSVVIETDGSVSILIGSGDREHPAETRVQNRMYLVRDTGARDLTDSDLQALTASTTQSDLDASKLANGWYFDLRDGEKVTGNTLTQAGVAYFNTNQPASKSTESCVTGLGTAREYTVEYNDAMSLVNYLDTSFGTVIPGGGFPPPPVPMTLKFDDGSYWSGVGGLNPTAPVDEQPGSRQKTFWSHQVDDK